MSSRSLTEYSRKKLLSLGMEEREMRADANTIYGVGIDLFQRNWRHWLEYHCGLAKDHGAVNFMRMLPLSDVTSDNYRCFTCIDGQQYLLAAMRRDKRFLPKPDNVKITVDSDTNGETDIFVPVSDPERFTALEVELELDADNWVELISEVFMTGTIEIVGTD